ncbi:hypothetical protein TCAL_12375 [Tigriopus californicus]|uniref:protein acetyllysine N-acetyltransferase n=1 Tax=Tigriopus californicus TaxID=6832 RepID=A0A553PRE4_TIGCA|nr:NAD-dependent protein deacetylase sirtuin-1-like [Tigriopus californicus]TRY80242.1 hypothetical protein TCAL_12375 [Tigriopus californicus]|eukprot:TCALIF_12375-PA protein Name:"Similar to SIRT1 NAD-dependent protein deacetylase sirtuin-1 (Homo sapiens)" AED:0.02 eAED:0.02 QI:61/1/1/1/0.5/0.4/5/141/851
MATWSPSSSAAFSPSPSPVMKRAKWDGLHLEPEAGPDWALHAPPPPTRPSRLTDLDAAGVAPPPLSSLGSGAALDSGFSDGATPPPVGRGHPDEEDDDEDEGNFRPTRHVTMLNEDHELSRPRSEVNGPGPSSSALGLDQNSSSSSASSSSSSSSSFLEHKNLPPPLGLSSGSLQRQSMATSSGVVENVDESSQMSIPGPSGLHHSNSNESGYTNENDEDDDCVSNISGLSGLSDLSGADWKATAGPFSWVRSQMMKGVNPREVLQSLISSEAVIPEDLDELTLWKIILNMLSEPPRRSKLTTVNTIGDVVGLIQAAKNIVVLTGAGVSVSCGIPDFRSRDGVYARLAVDFPDLPDPQAMFDIQYFRRDPRPFFKFAREIYPGQFKPSPCHHFIRALEKHERLLRNYTQNIDTLEQVVGIQRSVQCHGSFATATCTKCAHKCEAEQIKADVFDQKIPYCPQCVEKLTLQGQAFDPLNLPIRPEPLLSINPSLESMLPQPEVGLGMGGPMPEPSKNQPSYLYEHPSVPGIMKPDIVFFGEGLGDAFHNAVAEDKNQVDLLIMIGSSLKVRPVALIPSSIPQSVPQILINREPLGHLTPDVELLGDCDGIVNQLCHLLGPNWEEPIHQKPLEQTSELLTPQSEEVRVSSLATRLPEDMFFFQPPSRYIFPGAEIKEMDLCESSSSSSSGGDEDGDGDESDDEAGAPSPSAYGTHHSPNNGPENASGAESQAMFCSSRSNVDEPAAQSILLPAVEENSTEATTCVGQMSVTGQLPVNRMNQQANGLSPVEPSRPVTTQPNEVVVAPLDVTLGGQATEARVEVAPVQVDEAVKSALGQNGLRSESQSNNHSSAEY